LTTPGAVPQPEAAAAPEGANAQLLTDLKATSAKRLVKSIERVDDLTPEEEAALDRGGQQALRGTIRMVQRNAWKAAFWLGLLVAVLTVIGVGALVVIFVVKIYQEGKIEGIIGQILAFIFGSFATIAVEYLFKKKRD
jgi:hypothetical protein